MRAFSSLIRISNMAVQGCAVVLQGRYIDHQALSAFGGQERITMVTSFRPRSCRIRDDTVLNTVRPISNLSDLYGQTVEYNLENAESRIRQMLKNVRESIKLEQPMSSVSSHSWTLKSKHLPISMRRSSTRLWLKRVHWRKFVRKPLKISAESSKFGN